MNVTINIQLLKILIFIKIKHHLEEKGGINSLDQLISGKLEKLKNKVDSINNRLSNLETKVDNFYGMVVKLKY